MIKRENHIVKLTIMLFAAVLLFHSGIWHAHPVGCINDVEKHHQACHIDLPDFSPVHHHGEDTHKHQIENEHHNWVYNSSHYQMLPLAAFKVIDFLLWIPESDKIEFGEEPDHIYHSPPLLCPSLRAPPILLG